MAATHPASAPSSLRIPSLDGVRCLGALLVVACHGVGTPGFPLGVANAYPLGYWGNLALQTFFSCRAFSSRTSFSKNTKPTGAFPWAGSIYGGRFASFRWPILRGHLKTGQRR